MQKAQKRNAAKEEKFWFRKDITTHISPPEANECCKKGKTNCDLKDCDMFGELTVNEIINGKVRKIVFFILKVTYLFVEPYYKWIWCCKICIVSRSKYIKTKFPIKIQTIK